MGEIRDFVLALGLEVMYLLISRFLPIMRAIDALLPVVDRSFDMSKLISEDFR